MVQEKQQPIKAIRSKAWEGTNAVIAAVWPDGPSKTPPRRSSWLRLSDAIKKHHCGIGLSNVPKFNCDLDALHSERWREAEDGTKERLVFSRPHLMMFAAPKHILWHTIWWLYSNDPLRISNGHFKSTPNRSPATSVCPYSVSVLFKAAEWSWTGQRSGFLMNHKGAFRITVVGSLYFSVPWGTPEAHTARLLMAMR